MIGQLRKDKRQAASALGRKKAASGVMRPQGKEKTHRGFLWAVVMSFGLLAVAGKGADDQKEGE